MVYAGIDGGGSTLRVAIIDDSLVSLAEEQRSTANPSVIGREAAAALIQDALRAAAARVSLPIEGVGIGVAGASAAHSADWLVSVIAAILPGVPVFPSTDHEIALVGAHGARRDAIILAGTGSVALAINARGERVQAGGWGYLLGDEGSGAWLALEALRACARWHDGSSAEAHALAQRVLTAFGFSYPTDLIAYVYRQPPPVRELAAHARIVLDAAGEGDDYAQAIVVRGAQALAQITRSAIQRAKLDRPTIQFCGGLLSFDNPLSVALCAELGLSERPVPLHSPVIGAALLAKLELNQ